MDLGLPALELPELQPRFQKMRTRALPVFDQDTLNRRAYLALHPDEAWRDGNLWYKLDGNQLRAYRIIRKCMAKRRFFRFLLNWARRTGKTFVLYLICVEDAIRASKRRFNVAAVTQKSLHQFVWPIFKKMLEDCPQELRPWMDEDGGRIEFRNHHGKEHASVIQMSGCDDAAAVERLRGPYSNGNVIEEMGTIPDAPGLVYILTSILNPQVKSTGGWTLMAMTPPKSSGHESAKICMTAEKLGPESYDYCTTFDCPRYTDEDHLEYMRQDYELLGLTLDEYIDTVDFRREWLAFIETDPSLAILKRWNPEKKKVIVQEGIYTPLFRDFYVSMDIGFSPDWTFILYAFWDFERKKLRIIGERVLRRMGTIELAAAIKEDEEKYFGYVPADSEKGIIGKGEPPFLRVADNNNPILLKDLATEYGLLFSATAKDDLQAAIANVDRWIANLTLEIDPCCSHLPAQMTSGVWNAKSTDFARTKDMGHFDGISSLIYLVRNVIPNIDRVPRNWGVNREDSHINNEDRQENDVLMECFFGTRVEIN